jgi:hypothetical protein
MGAARLKNEVHVESGESEFSFLLGTRFPLGRKGRPTTESSARGKESRGHRAEPSNSPIGSQGPYR